MRVVISGRNGPSIWCGCFFDLPASGESPGTDSAAQQLNPAAAAPATPLVMCPAGAPLGALELEVQAGGQRLPFRTINRLSEGDTLLYAPVLRGKEKRRGEVALVLVPQKREPGQEDIIVTDPESADKPHEWKMSKPYPLRPWFTALRAEPEEGGEVPVPG